MFINILHYIYITLYLYYIESKPNPMCYFIFK